RRDGRAPDHLPEADGLTPRATSTRVTASSSRSSSGRPRQKTPHESAASGENVPARRTEVRTAMAVLLLNASYEPLRVIPLRRAIGLMVAEKVEVLAEGEGDLHSARMTMPVPAVVRLQYM